MASIILSLEDLGTAMPLQEALEARGHEVTWDGQSAAGPGPTSPQPDIVVLDGECSTCARGAEAWRDHDPPPGVLIVGKSQEARQHALRARCSFLSTGASSQEMEEELAQVLRLRFAARMSGSYARGVLGLGAASHPGTDAMRIVAGARDLDVEIVRECLRWRANDYVTGHGLIATLRDHHALKGPEVEITGLLDGTRTVQRLVASARDGLMAGRLLWALLSCQAASCTPEPPDQSTTERKQIIHMRQHLRARLQRLRNATHYEVLEVGREAQPERVDYAARTLAVRFSPDKLSRFDLGDLSGAVVSNWQQILVARKVLMGPIDRANYDDTLAGRTGELTAPWAFEVSDAAAASECYQLGQAALVGGEAFKAVSKIAAACRHHPDHPVYEASLCWARFRAELARGGDRALVARKERAIAEEQLWGRRPWPQALVALALLCAADGDAASARFYLDEALAVNPNLPAAKQLLGKLGR